MKKNSIKQTRNTKLARTRGVAIAISSWKSMLDRFVLFFLIVDFAVNRQNLTFASYSFFDRVEEGLIDLKYYKTEVIFHNRNGINGEPQYELARLSIHAIDKSSKSDLICSDMNGFVFIRYSFKLV